MTTLARLGAAVPSSGYAGACVTLLIGALGALGQAPFGLAPATMLAVILGFLLFDRTPTKASAFRAGWLFGFGYFLVTLHWIVEPFQVDAARHGWMAPFALVLLVGGMALFWGAAFWLARWLRLGLWGLALTWPLTELARAYLFTGFPWGNIPQAFVDGRVGQGLAYLGPHGFMVVLACLACLAAALWWRHWAGGLLALGLVVFAGLPAPLATVEQTPHTIRIVQPNAPQDEKWDPDKIPIFMARQLDFIAAEGTPDLVLLPETALPYLVEYAQIVFDKIGETSGDAVVALGIQRRDGQSYFNSAVVLDPAGEVTQVYDKHHLVPFGEYMPAEWFFRRINVGGLAARAEGGYAAGPGPQLLDFGPLGKGLPLICYEAVFAHDVGQAPSRPAFLVQFTNDAWFGNFAGPQQHLAQARMRAIEQGLPMVRSANTGISAMIGPRGAVLDQIPLNTAGFVDARLPAPLEPTLYARTGDWPWIIALLIVLFGAAARRIKRSIQNVD